MIPELTPRVERFHSVLVEEILRQRPDYLRAPFSIAEIYQTLVPYRSHRAAIGVEMNGDYEDSLLRLLAGAGDLLILESEPAKSELRRELESNNPNTGLFREYASAQVRLNQASLPRAEQNSLATFDFDPESDASDPATVESAPTEVAAAAEPRSPEASEPSDARPDGPADFVEPHRGLDPEDVQPEAWPLVAFSDSADEQSPETVEPPEPDALEEPTPVVAEVTEVAEVAEVAALGGVRCLWCGDELPEGRVVNFCPHCGSSTSLRPCRGCGEEMELSWRFCVECGALSADAPDA